MAKTRFLSDVHRLAGAAMAHGAKRIGPGSLEWDIGGRCISPVTIEHFARPDLKNGRSQAIIPGQTRSAFRVIMHYPCRSCERCLASRAAKWRDRARSETRQAHRTWMATLTFAPEEWWRILVETRHKYSPNDLEKLDPKERIRLIDQTVYRRLQLYLKRIRKNSGAQLRFIAVCEQHKSGVLHYHLLVHETTETPVRYEVMNKAWPHGHSHHKLLSDPERATYVCKYLAKSLLARVRASRRYGETREAHSPQDDTSKDVKH